MTYLELVNEVLKTLREDTVSTTSETAYSTFISSLVNRAKEEVEASWQWSGLCEVIQVTTAGDGSTYTATLAGTTDRTELITVYNSTDNYYVDIVGIADIFHLRNTSANDLSGDISSVADYGTSSDLKRIAFFRAPSEAVTLNCYVYNQQDTLASEDTTLTVPSIPVWKLAYAYAVSERGEDGGAIYSEVDAEAKMALNDAILKDSKHRQKELTWTAV